MTCRSPKTLEEDITKFVESKGSIVLRFDTNKRSKMAIIKCSCGIEFSRRVDGIEKGLGLCRACASKNQRHIINKISFKQAKKLVEDKGGILLTKEKDYKNTKTKLNIVCELGHIFDSDYAVINKGHWCSICGVIKRSEKLKLTIEDVRIKLLSIDLELLSDKYKNAKSIITVKCLKDGHTWQTTMNMVWYRGDKCGRCAGKCIKTYEEMVEIINEKGGELISKPEEIICADSRLKIKCNSCDNIWTPLYRGIFNSHRWCPICKSSKKQHNLYNILKKLYPDYNIEYNYRGFDWLKSDNNSNMEVDIWVYNENTDFSLAVEYDGLQHFKPVSYGRLSKEQAEKAFERRKFLDDLKDKLIKENNNIIKYFIRINYNNFISKNNIQKLLKENNIPLF